MATILDEPKKVSADTNPYTVAEPDINFNDFSFSTEDLNQRQKFFEFSQYVRQNHVDKGFKWTIDNERDIKQDIYDAFKEGSLFLGDEEQTGQIKEEYKPTQEQKLNLIEQWSSKKFNQLQDSISGSDGITDADKALLDTYFDSAKKDLVDEGAFAFASVGDDLKINSEVFENTNYRDNFEKAFEAGIIDPEQIHNVWGSSQEIQGTKGIKYHQFKEYADINNEITEAFKDFQNKSIYSLYDNLDSLEEGEEKSIMRTLLMAFDEIQSGSLKELKEEGADSHYVGILARALRKTRALDRGLDEASAPSREVLYKWIEESMTQRDMLKTDYEEKDLTANIKRAGLTGIVVHPQLMAKKDDFLKALDTFGVTEFERKATIEKRDSALEQNYYEYDKLLTESTATSEAWIEHKTSLAGENKSNREIFDSFVADDDNYSNFTNLRAAAWDAIVHGGFGTILAAIPAMSGSEGAREYMVDVMEDASRRHQVANLFGRWEGAGGTFVQVGEVFIPSIVDIGIGAIGSYFTGGLAALPTAGYITFKQGVRSGIKAATRKSLATQVASESSEQVLKSMNQTVVKEAIDAGADVVKANGLKTFWKEFGTQTIKLSGTTFNRRAAGIVLPAFTRSAGSTYANVYNILSQQEKDLPEDERLGHDNIHKAALGTGITAGLFTAGITLGFSAFGKGGLEKALEKGLTGKEIGHVLARIGSGVSRIGHADSRKIAASVVTAGLKKNTLFRNAFGSIKNLSGDMLAEAFEEGIDEAFNTALVQSATQDNLDFKEIAHGAMMGALLGGLTGGLAGSLGSTVRRTGMALGLTDSTQQQEALASRMSDEIIAKLEEAGSPLAAQELRRFTRAVVSGAEITPTVGARERGETTIEAPVQPREDQTLPLMDRSDRVRETAVQLAEEEEQHRFFDRYRRREHASALEAEGADPLILSSPKEIEAAKVDPDYVVSDQGEVLGVRNPFTGRWVGQEPSQEEATNKLMAFRLSLPESLRERRKEHERTLNEKADVVSSVESSLKRLSSSTQDNTTTAPSPSDEDIKQIVAQLEDLVTEEQVVEAINLLAEENQAENVSLQPELVSALVNNAFVSDSSTPSVVSESSVEDSVPTKELDKDPDSVEEAVDNLRDSEGKTAQELAELHAPKTPVVKEEEASQLEVNAADLSNKEKETSDKQLEEVGLKKKPKKKTTKKKTAKKKVAKKKAAKTKVKADEFISDKKTSIEVAAFNALVHAGEPVQLESGKYGMPIRSKVPKGYYEEKTKLLQERINEKYPKKKVSSRGLIGLRGNDGKVIRGEDNKVSAYVTKEGLGSFDNDPETVALLLSRGVPVRIPAGEENINPRIVFDDSTRLVKEVIYRDRSVGLNVINEPLPTYVETLQKTRDLIDLFAVSIPASNPYDFGNVLVQLRPKEAPKGEPRLRKDVADQANSAVQLEARLLEQLLAVRQQLINDDLVYTKETKKGPVLMLKKGAVNSFLDIWPSLDMKGTARILADSLPILGNPSKDPSSIVASFLKDYVLNNNLLQNNTMPELDTIVGRVKSRYLNLQKRRANVLKQKVWKATKKPLDESQNPVSEREFASLVDPIVAAGLPERSAKIVLPLTRAATRLLSSNPAAREQVNNFLARKVYSRSSRAYVESLSNEDALGALFSWATSGPNEDADLNTLYNFFEQLPKSGGKPLTSLLRIYWSGSDAMMGNLDDDSVFRVPFKAYAARILGKKISDRQATNIIRSIRSASIELFANSYASSLTQEQIVESNTNEINDLQLESGNPESVIKVLKKVISNKKYSPFFKVAAKILLQNSKFINTVNFTIQEKGNGYAGKYTKSKDGQHTVAIFLDGHNGAGVVGVLLHEYLHALTADVVSGISPQAARNTGQFNNVRTPAQEKALSDIKDLMVEINSLLMEQGDMNSLNGEALSNPDEFIAYVFTSPQFQAALRNLKAPKVNRTLLHRVLDKILGLFGLNVAPAERVIYNEALEKITAFTNTVNKTGKGDAISVSSAIERSANATLKANANSVDILNPLQGAPQTSRVERPIVALPSKAQQKREDDLRKQLERALLSSLSDGTPADQVVSEKRKEKSVQIGATIMSRLQSHARRHNVELAPMSLEMEKSGATMLMSGNQVQVSIPNLVAALYLNQEPMTPHAVIKTVDYIFNEEIGHVAAIKAVDRDSFDKLVSETDDREFREIAEKYYSINPEGLQRSLQNLESEDADVVIREKRALMDENLRMQVQMRTRGTTTEEAIAFFRTNPTASKIILQATKNMFTRMVVSKRYSKDNPRYYQALKNLREEVEAMTRGYRYDSGVLSFDPAAPADSLYTLQDQILNEIDNVEGMAFGEDYQKVVTQGDKGGDNLLEKLNEKFTKASKQKEVDAWKKRNPQAARKLNEIVSNKLKDAGYADQSVPSILLDRNGDYVPISRRINANDAEERRASLTADQLDQSVKDWRLSLNGDNGNDSLQESLSAATQKVDNAFESGEDLVWPNAGVAEGESNEAGPKMIWSALGLRYPEDAPSLSPSELELLHSDDLIKVRNYTRKLLLENARNEAYLKWAERNPRSNVIMGEAVRVGQESEGMDRFYHGTYNHFNPLYEFKINQPFNDPNPVAGRTSSGTTKGFSATPVKEYAEGWALSGQGTHTLGSKLVNLGVEKEFKDTQDKQEFMKDFMQVVVGGYTGNASPRTLYTVGVRTTGRDGRVYDFRNPEDVDSVARSWFESSEIVEELQQGLRDFDSFDDLYSLEQTRAGKLNKEKLYGDPEYTLESDEEIETFVSTLRSLKFGTAGMKSALGKFIIEHKKQELAAGNWQTWESQEVLAALSDVDAVRMKEHGPLDELYGEDGRQTSLDPTNIYVTNSKIIKLADPVTWDNQGTIIDVGTRNNFNSVDIRLTSVRNTGTVDGYFKDLLMNGDEGGDNLITEIKGGLIADTAKTVDSWVRRNPITAEKLKLINNKLNGEEVDELIQVDQEGNVILPVARFDLSLEELDPKSLREMESKAELGQYTRALKDNPDSPSDIQPLDEQGSGFNPWVDAESITTKEVEGSTVLYSSLNASPSDQSNIPLDIGAGRQNLGSAFKQLLQMPFFHTGEYKRSNSMFVRAFSGELDNRVKDLDDNRIGFQKMVTTAIEKYKSKLDKLLKKSFGSIEAAPAELLRDAIGSTDGAYPSDEEIQVIEDDYQASIEDTIRLQRAGSITFEEAKTRYENAASAKSKRIQKAEQNAIDSVNKRKANALQRLSRLDGGEELVKHLVSLRNLLDDLSLEVKSLYNLSDEVAAHFDANMGIYLTRSYKMFTEVGFAERVMNDSDYATVRNEAADFFEDHYVTKRKEHFVATDGMSSADAEAKALQELKDYKKNNYGRRLGMDQAQEYVDSFEYQADKQARKTTPTPLQPVIDSLKKRKRVPKALRALLGENVDEGNVDNIFRTISTVGMMASNQAFLQHTATLGRQSGWLLTRAELEQKINDLESKGDTKKAEYYRGFKPVRGRQVIGGAARSGKYDPFTNFVDSEGVNQGALLGPPEFADGMEAHFSNLKQLSKSDSGSTVVDKVFKLLSRSTGLSMALKTLGGFPGFYLRNALSNMLYFGPMQGMMIGTGLSQLVKQTTGATSDRVQTLFGRINDVDVYKLRLVGLNIVGDEVQTSTISELLRGERDMQTMTDELEGILKTIESKTIKGKAKVLTSLPTAVLKKAQALSQAIDAAHKIAYFEHELKVLREARDHANAVSDGSIYEGRSDEELERMASKKVLMTAQSYSQTLPVVKSLQEKGLPIFLSPFLRFKTEVPRITVNTGILLSQEMKSGNAVMKRRGQRRLAGSIFAIGGLSVGASLILKSFLDIGDDEEETARQWAPKYARGDTNFYYKDKDNDIKQFSLTFINPFAMLIDPFIRGVESLLNGRVDDFLGDTVGTLLFQTYFDEQILWGTLSRAIFENEDPQSGLPLVDDNMTGSEKMEEYVKFIYRDAFEPKTFKAINKAADALGEDIPDWEFTATGILAQEVRPFKIYQMNPDSGVGRYLNEQRDSYNRARSKKNILLSENKEFSEEEIRDLVREEYRRIARIHENINKHIQGSLKLGYSKEEAFRKMKELKYSKQRLYMLDTNATGRMAPSEQWQFNMLNREKLKDGRGKRRLDIFMDEWNKLPVLEPIK